MPTSVPNSRYRTRRAQGSPNGKDIIDRYSRATLEWHLNRLIDSDSCSSAKSHRVDQTQNRLHLKSGEQRAAERLRN